MSQNHAHTHSTITQHPHALRVSQRTHAQATGHRSQSNTDKHAHAARWAGATLLCNGSIRNFPDTYEERLADNRWIASALLMFGVRSN